MMESGYKMIDRNPTYYEVMQLKSNLLILLLKGAEKAGVRVEDYTGSNSVVADDLRSGDLSNISVDELLRMAITAGYTLDMVFNPNNTAKPLSVTVQGQIKSVDKEEG